MAGSIVPLPVMLSDEDRKTFEKLTPPKTIVVRYGYMRMLAELPYNGDSTPGCGSKIVIRSQRGMELAEMLTTTCANSGCGSSVSRNDMLKYFDQSGGKNYPFTTQGKVLRVANIDDMNEQARIDDHKPELIKYAREQMREMKLDMKLVDVELLLGGERTIFHYTAEDWVDFRELVKKLAHEYQTRIEMHQVNARDEARIVADYEKCGQHCCCKQFLKVLKPVSMRSAKVQKATLDPTKISGRCGRLMCCLRYEDENYEELRKRLPHRQSRVKTEDGLGKVIDSQILTQLILVQLDSTGARNAYPLENIQVLTKEQEAKLAQEQAAADAEREEQNRRDSESRGRRRPRGGDGGGGDSRGGRGDGRRGGNKDQQARRPKPGAPLSENEVESREGKPVDGAVVDGGDGQSQGGDSQSETGDKPKRKGRRRRRRRNRGGGGNQSGGDGGNQGGGSQGGGSQGGGGGSPPTE